MPVPLNIVQTLWLNVTEINLFLSPFGGMLPNHHSVGSDLLKSHRGSDICYTNLYMSWQEKVSLMSGPSDSDVCVLL